MAFHPTQQHMERSWIDFRLYYPKGYTVRLIVFVYYFSVLFFYLWLNGSCGQRHQVIWLSILSVPSHSHQHTILGTDGRKCLKSDIVCPLGLKVKEAGNLVLCTNY